MHNWMLYRPLLNWLLISCTRAS